MGDSILLLRAVKRGKWQVKPCKEAGARQERFVIMSPMNKVLLIDDDVELVGMFQEYLAQEGFEVSTAHDGEAGTSSALTGAFAIAVLVVMMPRMNGLETLRRIRAVSQMPILMLTARGDDTDRIVGLELGADDYVTKPCTPRELTARIRAILRRTQGASNDGPGITLT